MSSSDLRSYRRKKAFVVGYTSRVGKQLVNELLKRKVFEQLVLIGRRQVPIEGELYKNAITFYFSALFLEMGKRKVTFFLCLSD